MRIHPARSPWFGARLPVGLRLLALLLLLCGSAWAQTLSIASGVQVRTSLSATTVTMTGRSELRLTNAASPLTGCTVNLNSTDAWLVFTAVKPSVVNSTYLSQVRINGATAVHGTNCRVTQYGDGALVLPHGPTYAAMEVFSNSHFLGSSMSLTPYTAYTDSNLGAFANSISSFKLKRGYTATVAQEVNGTGVSKNYVAQDGDIEVSLLPTELNDSISFIRIFPWRWTNKKGIAGNIASGLNVGWDYNWNLDRNSTLDVEYVGIRQSRWWPSMSQDWQARGVSHLLGYNEPDNSIEANLAVADAIWSWPDLLGTGLRLGSPAPTDGGRSWLYSFIDSANAASLRVDFVAVHYYWAFSNAADPDGATTQFYNFLKAVYDRTGKPIWVTEWNNGANWTTAADPTYAQQAATIGKMIDMLESTPWIERYAIYNWVEDVRRVKWDDGSLTSAGVVYRDKDSALAYNQVIPSVATPQAARYDFELDTKDTAAYGRSGIPQGAPTYAAGRTGQAINLNATTGDHVRLPPDLGDSTDFTFGAWVNWNGGSAWQRIFDLGNGTGSYIFLTPSSSAGTLRFGIKAGGSEQTVSAASALPTGVWTHVAVTVSGNTGKLFVNGVLVATNTSMTINPVDVGAYSNYLGRSQWPADPYFSGQLDEVVFLPYALSDTKVAAMQTNRLPVFSSKTLTGAAGTHNVAYSGSVAPFVTDPDTASGDTITFSKASGPAWLSVAANGALSGTPTFDESGAQVFVIYAVDSAGGSAVAQLTITLPPVLGNGTWASDGDGLWSEISKWTSSFPANGAGYTANFSLMNISANRTVTLDASRTLGTLAFGDTSGTQNWTLAANSGRTLTLEGTASAPSITVGQNLATITAPLAGTAGFTKSGAGTLVLAGPSTVSGILYADTSSSSLNGGALRLAHPSAAAAATEIQVRNNNSGYSTLEFDGTAGAVETPALLRLSGRNSTVAGLRNIAGANHVLGQLSIGVGGSNYVFQSDAGTLTLDGGTTSVATGARTLTFQGAGSFSLGGLVQNGSADGGLALVKNGAGTLTLNGPSNSFTGNIVVNGGTLEANAPDYFNNTGAAVIGPLGNPRTTGRTITLNSGSTLLFSRGNVLASGGTTSAPLVSITANTGATIRLNAVPSPTPGSGGGDCNVFGPLILNGGTLTTGNGYSANYNAAILLGTVSATGASTSLINTAATNTTANGLMLGRAAAPSATFDVSGTGGLIVSAPLVNAVTNIAASLVKTGTGTLTLTAANTYAGATAVSAGTLLVNGSTATGSVNVSAGATLGGSGTVGGSATIQTGAALVPGGVNIGTFTVAGSLTLQSGTTTTLQLSRNDSTADKLVVGGTFTRGGALTVTNLGGSFAAGDLFDLFDAGTVAGAFASVSLPALSSDLQWNTSQLDTGVLSIEYVASYYAGWKAGFAFAPGDDAPDADPDGDGLANVFEWLLIGDPLVSESSLQPRTHLVAGGVFPGGDPAKQYLALTATVRKTLNGATLTPQAHASLDQLGTPASEGTVVSVLGEDYGEFELRTWVFTQAVVDSGGRGFIRLKLTVP